MKHKESLKFTNRKHTIVGIMSTTFGTISVLFLILFGVLTIKNNGAAPVQYGAACLFDLLIAVTGLIAGIIGCAQKESFKIFPIIGIIVSVIGVAATGGILYLGVR